MEKIEIWNDVIPYNHAEIMKKDIMCIRDMSFVKMAVIVARNIFGKGIAKDASALDTFTYKTEIESGNAGEYMDDVPTLIPFICPGADTAVIIAPGGGFATKDRENEGYRIADALNEKGISAFVLDYRLNPYEAPVMYLDMQRAVRYVRYHAEEFGLAKNKIGTMGFSAGGYVAGASAILLSDTPVEYDGYVSDEVDRISGLPDFIGLIYPVTNFDFNPSMLCLVAGDDFFDPMKRPVLQHKYSLTDNLKPSCIPQFVCYGSLDPLKGMDRYINRLKELNIPHESHIIKWASHGFALKKKHIARWFDEYTEWIKNVSNAECL